MTFIGKVLVVGMTVFALMFAALAVSLSSNAINWAGTPQDPGRHDAVVKQIKEKVEDLGRQRSRWKDEGDALAAQEARRAGNRQAYADSLAALRTGKDTKGQVVRDPVRSLTYDNNGRLRLDANERPVLGPNPDAELKDLDTLNKQLTRANDDFTAIVKEINDLIEEEKKLTLTLQGEPGKKRGLLTLLEESKRDLKNAQAELEFARTEATNGRVAVQSLLKRKRQLEARVQELKKEMGVAQGGP